MKGQLFVVTLLLNGSKSVKEIYAQNKTEVLLTLKKVHGIKVLKIEPKKMPRFDFHFQSDVDTGAYIAFLRELQVMCDAGISIHLALTHIVPAIDNPPLKTIFSTILEEIQSGKSLSGAFEKHQKALGFISVSFIKLAEHTGNISDALMRLIDLLEALHENKKRFAKVLFYPSTVLFALLIAFVVLINFVLPQFAQIFEKLQTDLPLPTRILLGIDTFFTHYGFWVLLISLLVIGSSIYMYQKNTQAREKIDYWLIHIPIFGKYIRYAQLSRFVLLLYELFRAGVGINEAILIANRSLANSYMIAQIVKIEKEVGKGVHLGAAMQQSGLFENIVLQLIKAGEQSGQLEKMLQKVYLYYHERLDHFIQTLGARLEPLLILIVGVMVLILALGVFMPMWNMAHGVKIH